LILANRWSIDNHKNRPSNYWFSRFSLIVVRMFSQRSCDDPTKCLIKTSIASAVTLVISDHVVKPVPWMSIFCWNWRQHFHKKKKEGIPAMPLRWRITVGNSSGHQLRDWVKSHHFLGDFTEVVRGYIQHLVSCCNMVEDISKCSFIKIKWFHARFEHHVASIISPNNYRWQSITNDNNQ